ncbi:chromosome partitioning protein ParA [Vibrio europaeus]|uniref:chromosome partitioning protein ParA n=1 Tax=Vibrio europaeus TaxID=300876 RepID=UPI00233E976A|nr:chromosome partitioning protein ParA [Vibrio europaeus]MDC5805291.1 chromosome partitioning protein ParA [Vibrio europaeus]MDC5826634.1 chromosome partitioning protein ParA [Vibrio europaeus]MDC5832000.1 chromosome partitioning protein ParA [Vibrio europaeus]MDC5834955.1 chromosome partitioning protein ParA [Vibrio europaeus]
MLRLLSLVMLVASASIIGSFVIEDPSSSTMNHNVNSVESVVEAARTPPPIDNLAQEDKAQTQAPSAQPNQPNANEWVARLSVLEGTALSQEIEAFWQHCLELSNCEMQLVSLKSLMTDSGYFLLANYPQLKQQWHDSLGTLELNQLARLADKIVEFKREAEVIWGQQAETIFSDQFAAYDFALDSQALADTAPDDYLAEFESLTQRWQQNATSVGLDGDVATFETAVSLIPASYSQQQRDAVVNQLAATYLSSEQINEISTRKQQVKDQQQEVQDYQSQLSALKSSLSQQRTSTYSAMTDSDWMAYYNEQISQFRVDFFNSK